MSAPRLARGALMTTPSVNVGCRRFRSSGTLDGPGNPAPDGAPRRQFKIDFEIAGVLFSIVGAGLMAVKHFDGKFDKVDQKFEKFDQKFDSINQKFDQKLDSIQASVSYLSARSERQYGFEEGARSVRVKEPPSSGD
mmetsp:Transcript_26844/g.85070  ORF Transcript_26844/g.85070 Transcript_26844/m.85070 type:complete len:137 (+) Transcript_26844:25-435(+)